LTGNADLQSAIGAINRGQIFRFLTKPCSSDQLAGALTAGQAHYRLVTAERELLEQTLSGSIKVLCDVLSLVNPEAFGRSARVSRYVEAIASHLRVPELWPVKTAAMLSQIGCVILPETVLKKVYRGETLTDEEAQLYKQHPFVAADLVAKIPRMKLVGDIIRLQDKHYDGGEASDGRQARAQIPLEARILKVALDFDALESSGKTKMDAFDELKKRQGYYDAAVVEAVKAVFANDIKYEMHRIGVSELRLGMILGEDIRTHTDVLLASKGQEVNESIILRMQNFARTAGVREPFTVLIAVTGRDHTASQAEARHAA
jgi:response regulator RpfG family c-di-GMP phosphodiesterase